MRKNIKVFALLLAAVMLLQSAALAAEPSATPDETDDAAIILQEPAPEKTESEAPAEASAPQGSVPDEPVLKEPDPEDLAPEEPAPSEPEPPVLTVTSNLTDGAVVNQHLQTLRLTAKLDDSALTPADLTVRCNGTVLSSAKANACEYALKLTQGSNIIEVEAQGQTVTLHVTFAILVPSGWAHRALQFCVDHNILYGDTNDDLRPTGMATRAELAAMLVRLFGFTQTDDLSSFTDIPTKAWYKKELGKAVAAGLLYGSGGKLTPEVPITREQAFAVFARAFGVTGGSADCLSRFSDSDSISKWARESCIAMVSAGYVSGTTAGTLNPKANITRQEVAQLIYSIIDAVADDPSEVAPSGLTLYRGDPNALNGQSFSGSLLVVLQGSQTLTDLKVAQTLSLRAPDGSTLTLKDCDFDTLHICSPANVRLESPANNVIVSAAATTVQGTADSVVIDADATLTGNFKTVTLGAHDLTVTAGTQVDYLNVLLTADGSDIRIDGNVQELDANAENLKIHGSGSIQTLYQRTLELDCTCAVGTVVDHIDAGLHGIRLTQSTVPTASSKAPTVTLTGKITGVDSVHTYGVPGGVRTCTVTCTYRGSTVKKDTNFQLTEGAEISCPITVPFNTNITNPQTVSVTITYGTQTYTSELKCSVDLASLYYNEAKNVKTVYVPATVRYNTSVYSSSGLGGYITSLPKGSTVSFLKNNGSSCWIILSNGTRGWVPSGCLTISQLNHTTSYSYPVGVREAFVNQVHNYSSSSKYLLWCNLYTRTFNVFEGSQGNWKLIKSASCITGANTSPTRPGVYKTYSRSGTWTYEGKTCVYYPTMFDGGIAVHSRMCAIGTHNYTDNLGTPISHGCVRVPWELAQWIYNTCPIGTTVVVY